MSKVDMLGPVSRALVAVPKDRLGLVLDVVYKLSVSGRKSEDFSNKLKEFLRKTQEGRLLIDISIISCFGNQEFVATVGLLKKKGIRTADPQFTREFCPSVVPAASPTRLQISTIQLNEVMYRDLIPEVGGIEKIILPFGIFVQFLSRFAKKGEHYLFFLERRNGEALPVTMFQSSSFDGWFVSSHALSESSKQGTVLVYPA